MSILGQRPLFENVKRFSLTDSRRKSVLTSEGNFNRKVMKRRACQLFFDSI